MDLWSARLVLTHLHLHQLRHHQLLQQQFPEPRVRDLSFQLWCFFFGGLPFALLVLQCRAAFSSLFFKYICHESSPFIWPSGPLSGCLGCCSLEWQPDSTLAFSFETLGLRLSFALPDQPPLPYHLENHLIWVDSIKVIPLACCCFIRLFCLIQRSLFTGKLLNSDPGLYSRYFDPVTVQHHHLASQ